MLIFATLDTENCLANLNLMRCLGMAVQIMMLLLLVRLLLLVLVLVAMMLTPPTPLYRDEFFEFLPCSYSRALPRTSSCALPQFSHGSNHRSYSFGS
jgi:uncharacterized membrane protein